MRLGESPALAKMAKRFIKLQRTWHSHTSIIGRNPGPLKFTLSVCDGYYIRLLADWYFIDDGKLHTYSTAQPYINPGFSP